MGNLFVTIDVNKDGKAYIAGIFPSLKLLKDKGFKELDKCQLICANCHREIHSPEQNNN